MVAQELYPAEWSLGKQEKKLNVNINVDVSVNETDGTGLGEVCWWTLLSTMLLAHYSETAVAFHPFSPKSFSVTFYFVTTNVLFRLTTHTYTNIYFNSNKKQIK